MDSFSFPSLSAFISFCGFPLSIHNQLASCLNRWSVSLTPFLDLSKALLAFAGVHSIVRLILNCAKEILPKSITDG